MVCPDCRCHVTSEGFAHMTAKLKQVASLAVLLEGGYSDKATAKATEACLRVLLGQTAPDLPPAGSLPSDNAKRTIQKVIQTQVCPFAVDVFATNRHIAAQ